MKHESRKFVGVHKYAGPVLGSVAVTKLYAKLPVSLTKNLTARQIAQVLIFAEQIRKDATKK